MKIDNYKNFTNESEIEYIKKTGALLAGKSCNMVTATSYGGVNEILDIIVPILQDFDVKIYRTNLKMPSSFKKPAQKMFEALSDSSVNITTEEIEEFFSYEEEVRKQTDIECDLLYVHDHQPITAVNNKNHKNAIWRCHLDISHSDALAWHAVKHYIEKYDAAAFSFPSYAQDIAISRFSIMPSIDPLSDKNKEISQDYIDSVFAKYSVPRDKPLLAQIGRFDAAKDPLGVIEVYKEVKNEYDCNLMLVGWKTPAGVTPSEDYQKVLAAAAETPGVYAVTLEHNPLEVNALQRGADIIIQKSLRESFGLTITEALWKKKAVVASETGGVPLQIMEGQTGLFSVSIASCASQVKRLLKTPSLQRDLGEGGHKHVRENFLITRHIRDLFIMFSSVFTLEDK